MTGSNIFQQSTKNEETPRSTIQNFGKWFACLLDNFIDDFIPTVAVIHVTY